MSFSTVLSAAVEGLRVESVHVEADVSSGLPVFHMVGYLSSEVKEAGERVRTAIRNSGFDFPAKRTVINLSPATMRKRGASFDLPIAAAILVSLGRINPNSLEKCLIIGELGLDGRVRKVPGILPIVAEAKRGGVRRCIVPAENAAEGALVEGVEIVGVENLQDTVAFLNVSGSMNQSIEIGEPIEAISYMWKNAEGVELTGELPDGVTFSADMDNKRFTIEGTPTVTGTFNFEVNTTGGETTATLSGTITIKPEAVLTELAYFPFDETSGTIAANRVYGQAEAVNFTPTWTEGVLGQALELPATPTDRRMQQVHYDDFDLATKSFSIECWFRSNGGNGVDWYLLHKGNHAKEEKWVGIQYKNGNLTFAIDDGISKTNLDVPATTYFNGKWHHLVCVRDRDNRILRMYVDGMQQGEVHDATSSISETDNLVIGNCNINFNTPFTGAIDELHIYEGAMSAKRVAERYNDPNVSGISSVETGRDEFVVYPALFTDEIAIQCPAEACGRCVMTIYSATDGRTVHQGIYNVDGGSVVYVRGLDGLAAGSYVLSIENGTERIVRKLLKANR